MLAGDRVLEFDLTQIAENAGSSIVADKIYIDASGDGGQYALGYWLADWEEHTGQLLLPPIEGLGDWSNKRSISVCVGSKVGFKTLDKQLRSIFLWYDSTVRTTIYNIKSEPGQPVHSPTNARNMANTDDALKVSKNGIVLRDTHEKFQTGSSQGTIPGPRVDLEPDFDVYDTDGNEISANCNNCMGKSVDVGQTVHAKLKTEVSNADAKDYKRSSNSETIEGPVWWMIEGKTGWNLLDSGEYTITNLNKGAATVETHVWAIPNYPGDILAMKACVDGDDEIWEEDEASGSGNDIDNPDQSGTSNNCSRRERFYIEHPNYTPTGAIESGTCTRVMGWAKDQNITGSVMVHAYLSEPDGSNEQYLESLMADKPKSVQGGNYGIDWSVSEAAKVSVAKKLTFRAVNTPEGTNPVIGSVTLTCVPETTPEGRAAVQILNTY
ncbi:MAG: hypothetical protein WBO92_01850 [Candidatus Moraniibacteriota bacterium]